MSTAWGQVDSKYEKALETIMKWADAEVMPDMDIGWPNNSAAMSIEGLDVDRLDKDLKTVLIDKQLAQCTPR